MARRALVTGADGLLGSHLVRTLLGKKYEVRVLVQPGSKSPTLDDLPIERVEGDLLGDPETLRTVCNERDVVFHCAAITDLAASDQLTWDVNLRGTEQLLTAMAAAKAGRLVFVGSASSFGFGDHDHPGDERASFPLEYRGLAYAESKHQAMQQVLDRARLHGFDAVVVAPTFMLGQYDSRPSSGELLLQFIKRPVPLVPPGGRNFVCASDVAKAMVAACERGSSGECYLLAGTNMSYVDFFAEVAHQAGLRQPRGTLPSALVRAGGLGGSLVSKLTRRPGKLNTTVAKLACLDTFYTPDKAVRELGMTHRPISAGIRESLASLLHFGHVSSDRMRLT